jgi:hypothetical protein
MAVGLIDWAHRLVRVRQHCERSCRWITKVMRTSNGYLLLDPLFSSKSDFQSRTPEGKKERGQAGKGAGTPLYGDFDVKNKNLVTSTSFLLSLFQRSELRQRLSFCSAPLGAHPSVPTRGFSGPSAQGRMAVVQVV